MRRFTASPRVMLGMCLLAVIIQRAAAQGAAPPPSAELEGQYMVEFKGGALPVDLSARVAALGGTIVGPMPEIGVVILANLTDRAASILRAQSDVADVTTDQLMSPINERGHAVANALPNPPRPLSATQPEAAMAFAYQWHMRAIGADQAWRAGYVGSPDVRIAVIDTGIDPTFPDLAALIDRAGSASYCPGEDALVAEEFPGQPLWTDLEDHGTHVASIAASEGSLVAGVTSRSSLMAIKVLGILPCPASGLTRAVYFAANHGADVINLSLGSAAPFSRSGERGHLHYLHLAIQYALVRGVSAVVVAAGNDAFDLDHSGNLTEYFCDVPGVICVSATGALDSGPELLGPFVNVDAPGFYTNFGASAIDVAAPGGNVSFDALGNVTGIGWVWGACASTDRQFDASGNLVPGQCSAGAFNFSIGIGTSYAAPHVSGLAALLVSQLGHGHAAQVKAAIENAADDLGKPGADSLYGKGRIDVARSLGIH
jgi:lantibiotic leader peptide-processing serine protease